MKRSEAIRIPALLAARQPPPTVEEATIDGIRMLVILGDEVDTVIQYQRNGGAKMPQLCTYPDIAESAAHADERLAKQRASGRKNTTGEGVEWPRNWKLAGAQAAGKIWYAGPKTERKAEAGSRAHQPQEKVRPTLLSVEELLKTHEEYTSTVPNSYVVTMDRIEQALAEQNGGTTANVLAEWLKDLNRQYYRFRPDEARELREKLEPLITAELTILLEFRRRRIATLATADEPAVRHLFGRFRPTLGPVGTVKAFHVLAPNFFPLWDDAIASDYRVSLEHGYFQFMLMIKQQIVNLPDELTPGLPALKAIDEYNYLRASKRRKS